MVRRAEWVAAVKWRGPFCCVNGPKHSVNPPYCLCRAPFQMKCIRRALWAAHLAALRRSAAIADELMYFPNYVNFPYPISTGNQSISSSCHGKLVKLFQFKTILVNYFLHYPHNPKLMWYHKVVHQSTHKHTHSSLYTLRINLFRYSARLCSELSAVYEYQSDRAVIRKRVWLALKQICKKIN